MPLAAGSALCDDLARCFARLTQGASDIPLLLTERGVHTVGEVAALAQEQQRRLRERALPGGLVGLQAGNGVGFLAGLVAAWRTGSAAVLVDAHATAAERATIASRLGVRTWLRCPRTDGRSFVVEDAQLETPVCDAGGASVIKLTSGSSGAPRGIAVEADSLLADEAALTSTMGLRPSDRLLTTVPFSHSYGLSSLVLPALLRGTPLLVSESGGWGALHLARRANGTVLFTVPSFLDALLRDPTPASWPSSIRLVVSAGARLAPEIALRFRERFDMAVHAFYGASECGGICYDRDGRASERGHVGSPVNGVEVSLEPLQPAQAGNRVVVRSPAVAARYLPEPDDHLGDGRFVTDDLGAWHAGELQLLGRVGCNINVRGYKVDPREIERVIAELPQVEEVHVLDVLDGRGQALVRAVIACRRGSLSASGVRAWCRERLAAHKVPRSIALVERIPRTSRGKVDRAWLETVDRVTHAGDHG